jgi:hypothetical protein
MNAIIPHSVFAGPSVSVADTMTFVPEMWAPPAKLTGEMVKEANAALAHRIAKDAKLATAHSLQIRNERESIVFFICIASPYENLKSQSIIPQIPDLSIGFLEDFRKKPPGRHCGLPSASPFERPPPRPLHKPV